MIQIVDYSPAWLAEFTRLAALLRSGLGPLALRIDHIGSTSVPGLSAKDVIDIQVTVADLTSQVAEAIEGAGFVRHPGTDRDHVPPGHPAAAAGWTKFLFSEPTGDRRANVHVRRLGSPNQRYALVFRDYLIAHPKVAMAYAELKRRLAVGLADPRTYPEVKDPVADLIYLAAEGWAASSKWSPA